MIPDINLIPKLEKEQSAPKILYLILGLVAILALIFLVWQYIGASKSISSLKSEEVSLQQQRDQLNDKVTELNTTNQDSIEDTIAYIDLISYPVLPLINEIEGLQTSNAHLREYSFGVEEVTVAVDFETMSDVSKYVTRLTNSEYFTDVLVNEVKQYDLGDQLEESDFEDFNVLPRHTANITLYIDEIYLATGGIR